jgi:hypothetical protein
MLGIRHAALTSLGSMEQDEIKQLAAEHWHTSLPDRVGIRINKAALDYDHILLLGPTFPHEVAGFSGGAKYLFPGISGPGYDQRYSLVGHIGRCGRHDRHQGHSRSGCSRTPRTCAVPVIWKTASKSRMSKLRWPAKFRPRIVPVSTWATSTRQRSTWINGEIAKTRVSFMFPMLEKSCID